MRKDKELREKAKRDKELQQQKALEEKKNAPLQSEFVRRVLENQPLLISNTSAGGAGEINADASQSMTVTLNDLKLSTFVVEMEFLPKPKIETYERECQCDLYEEGIVKLPSTVEQQQDEQ